ncbi:pentapeptide repeat-containing protein [Microcystis aeruginosa]
MSRFYIAADLRGADLSEAYLGNANLRGANLCRFSTPV